MRVFHPSLTRFFSMSCAMLSRAGIVALICAVGAAVVYLAPGCSESKSGSSSSSSNRSSPTLDARGGASNGEGVAGIPLPLQGSGGDGGSIDVLSVGAGILRVTDALPSAEPMPGNFPTTLPTASGFDFLDVAPGERREVAGSYQVDWLRVQNGGSLVLKADTFFVVYGDVEVSGTVRSAVSSSSINGYDFTVDADGILTVTGTIDCSGFTAEAGDQAAYDPSYEPGGDGGELYISSIPRSGDVRQPRIYVDRHGKILSNGGSTVSLGGTSARAGRGGQILIGCVGDMMVAGTVSAHGGKSKSVLSGAEGDGGAIELVASGNVDIMATREIDAAGGGSSGALAGKGGKITLESTAGTLDLVSLTLACRGGAATHFNTGMGGAGGTVTLKGVTVVLDGTDLDVSGGDSKKKGMDGTTDPTSGGLGGEAGTAQVSASSRLYLGKDPVPPLDPQHALAPVEILAVGGHTANEGFHGGNGGNIKLINTSQNTNNFTFEGMASVLGGKAPSGLYGQDGYLCTTGAGLDAAVAIIGENSFPNSLCTQGDLQGLTASIDLSCDNTVSLPSNVDTSTPVVIGVSFFRVAITETMRTGNPPTPYLTITTEGALDGDLDLYVGPASAFGSYNPGSYTFGSRVGPDDGKNTICIDTSGDPDNFVSVMVVEKNNFVEKFSISVACAGTGCN